MINNGLGVSPDEFWSEKEKDNWREAERKEYVNDKEPKNKRYDFYDTLE